MTNAREWGALQLMNLSAQTTTTQSLSPVDLAQYASLANREMKATFQVFFSAQTPSLTVAVTECDTTNGTFTAPNWGTSTAAVTTNGLTELNFRADKRYIRAEVTFPASGVTNSDLNAVAFALKREANS